MTVERMARDYKSGTTEMLHASGYRAIVTRSHAAEWLYRAPNAKGTLAPDVWETLERGADEIDKAEDLFLRCSPVARESAQAWAEESHALAAEWEDIPAAMAAWAAWAAAVDAESAATIEAGRA